MSRARHLRRFSGLAVFAITTTLLLAAAPGRGQTPPPVESVPPAGGAEKPATRGGLRGSGLMPPPTARAVADPMTMHARPQGFDGKAITLFDGSTWQQWTTRDGAPSGWIIQNDGTIEVKGGDAMTTRSFGDFQLHLEFRCPEMKQATGQARANSGVYLHGRYEIQILDSYGQAPSLNGCGALYMQAAPAVNAGVPADFWQSYDIVFRAPRFDEAGAVTERPRVTVLHNGVVIHNNIEITGPTGGAMGADMAASGPILLQDHGDPIRFRNIWIRPLSPVLVPVQAGDATATSPAPGGR